MPSLSPLLLPSSPGIASCCPSSVWQQGGPSCTGVSDSVLIIDAELTPEQIDLLDDLADYMLELRYHQSAPR